MDKLRAWLDLTGCTIVALARDVDVTPQTVHNWLAGRNHPGGLELRRLHEVTKLPLDDLVPRDDERAA